MATITTSMLYNMYYQIFLDVMIGGWGGEPTGKSISVSVRVVRAGEAKLCAGIGHEARAKSRPEFRGRGGGVSNLCPDCARIVPGPCPVVYIAFLDINVSRSNGNPILGTLTF